MFIWIKEMNSGFSSAVVLSLSFALESPGEHLKIGDEGTTQIINSASLDWASVTSPINKFPQVIQIMSLNLGTTFP